MLENQENQDQEIVPETIELKKEFEFVPGRHIYRQEGPYLVCRGCELNHALYVGMENIMVGEDENGKPVLRRRSELNLAS